MTLVGLRLGGTLAAQASVDLAKAVDGLVLWDPVTDGAAYIDEMYAICRAQPIAIKDPVARPTSLGGGVEILGFPLTERIHGELGDLSLAAIARDISCPVHTVVSGPESACRLVSAALKDAPSREVQRMESLPIWLEDWPRNSGFVPVKILQQIVQWIA